MRTLLLSMPFGAIDRPALGISLLKSACVARGLACEVAYPIDLLVARIGLKDYIWLTDELPYTAFAGDWCFANALHGPDPDSDWAYVHEILLGTWGLNAATIRRLLAVRMHIEAYLDDVLVAHDWAVYDVVGFTSTFAQNIASLALARRLRAHAPHLRIVFGGANWEGEMGAALFETFPFVDFVCRGEADESFPLLLESLAQGNEPGDMPGVLNRNMDGACAGPPAPMITEMDALPVPDFDAYFAMLDRWPALSGVQAQLPMETSRGCWWGAKHHCTFCGLNGTGMAFRSKSASRAISELRDMLTRHPVPLVAMTDNILDMAYFKDFIPALADNPLDAQIFYETKSNLSRVQVRALANAGVTAIQPGIESLSDRVLKLMRKGTTALQNIQLLRWCAEYNVSVEWNVLYGFPGEAADDYDEMLRLMGQLHHLQAPSGMGPVRIDRFSPYHQTPEAYGLGKLVPLPVFAHLYRRDVAVLTRIAAYFEPGTPPVVAGPETVARIEAAVEGWRAGPKTESWARDDGKALHLSGTTVAPITLTGLERSAYIICDRVASPAQVAAGLSREGGSLTGEDVTPFLDDLVEAGVMIRSNGKYLALAVFDRFPDLPTAGLAKLTGSCDHREKILLESE